jgi:hypothetical protein
MEAWYAIRLISDNQKSECARAVKRIANYDIFSVLMVIMSLLAGVWKIDLQWRRALT